ncbi:NADPH-dependent FMN reductase [Actinophytocola xinjiangensis]|uniref:NADPH-dependent FMN reductase n=1 Tax=Actinophytocola xinjiangensis TaxID=485602 RepID=A0A7Z0WCR2_9PSEU|nr:NAD(P)H-dependent oxidoreductase [Actinophytocola xinjiangensis]OLF04348.1 NADPH-dependent FMN reductase [Actinophytocola xinjiangensis]
MDTRLRVAVIIGSTRDGRVGESIGTWFVTVAQRRDDVELDVVDLRDFVFPERYPEGVSDDMRRFCSAIGRADGFVVVTPEYNRSFPASLKQAIDFAYDEWHAKPAGFVSYGCRNRGHYAVEALRDVFTELHVMTVRDEVAIDLLALRGDGVPGDEAEIAVRTMLDQLAWWGVALRDARARHPYTE